MTKEEAINLLTQVNKIIVNNNSWLESTHEPLNTAFAMAIEALELQVPNEWETEEFNPTYFSYIEPKIIYICPNCRGIADTAYKYCPHCGKAKIKKEIKDL